jgi:hypothetical protein
LAGCSAHSAGDAGSDVTNGDELSNSGGMPIAAPELSDQTRQLFEDHAGRAGARFDVSTRDRCVQRAESVQLGRLSHGRTLKLS